MKNNSKVNFVFVAFLFVLSCGMTAFAQNQSSIVVDVAVVEADVAVAEKSARAVFGSSSLLSNADFQKNYLDKGKLLNKVSLVTTNGVTNELALGSQIPVVVRGKDVETVEFINAGFSLKATPQIIENADGKTQTIRLSLELSDNEADSSSTSEIPVINKRQIQTVISLKYGETAVLGGYAVDGVTRYYGISLRAADR